MKTILAINPLIGSSVGIFKDGIPEFCIQEERLNRVKNWIGFPELSLKFVLENISDIKEIDQVVLCNSKYYSLNRDVFYGIYDYNFSEAKKNITSDTHFLFNKLRRKFRRTRLHSVYEAVRYKNHLQELNIDRDKEKLKETGFSEDKITRVDHHLCHAGAAYFGLAQDMDSEYLIFTLDGGGDEGITGTVYKGHKGELTKLSESKCYSIGNMYSAVTHYLGFTPHEHEYKLMGLAPYVQKKYIKRPKTFFERFLKLKEQNSVFFNPEPINHQLFNTYMLQELTGERFDNIAAGLQDFTEEIITNWVKGNIEKYQINNILCAGGVFMNVKANMLLSHLKEIAYIDVFPSCGDESNIFGAAFASHNNERKQVNLLKEYTLGPDPGKNLKEVFQKYGEQIEATELENANSYIADQLVKNKIVARCSGKMEFGARALGNRSILANPTDLININKINQAVKKRDFWMPFAPAILEDKVQEFLRVPPSLKNQLSSYMMFAFDTFEDNRKKIICGIHQADFTARAETVSKEKYPDFYEIINSFCEKTGVPCVLNTSFNLHGYPIVENSNQAIKVLLNSEIDILVIENYAVKKKR